MADIVVYEDSPLAQYLQEIQGDQPGSELQHIPVPVKEPAPPPDSIGVRLAQNAAGIMTHVVDYLSHAFSTSAADNEDAAFEEQFQYFICTSPFLNKAAATTTHDRGRRADNALHLKESSALDTFGKSTAVLGCGAAMAAMIARKALGRSRFGHLPWIKPLLGAPVAATVVIASSAWMLRILRRRNIQSTQSQALRSLQVLVDQCQTLDAKVNRAIMVIQEIELVSRGYRLSTPLAPISRIEQASKTRRCNMVRAQLVAALVKSGLLFQKSTETLQSHIDHKRLSTLLDMYNIRPSSRPSSPKAQSEDSRFALWTAAHFATLTHNVVRGDHPTTDPPTLTASPTSDMPSPFPAFNAPDQHSRSRSGVHRRSRTMTGGNTGGSNRSSRTDSFYGADRADQKGYSGRHAPARRHTSWSASEGEESDSALSPMVSPRSSTSSNGMMASPEMTSLEKLRKKFQRMHGYRREFLCELLSIRRKSRKGRQGVHALKDYDRNWTVVRNVLQEGVAGIEAVVDELNKVLDAELYTLPRIDTQSNSNNNSAQDKRLQPFVYRLALLEQHVRGVQAKLYICNQDIQETVRQESVDDEKKRLLESQFDSISQDIGMMASEWQLGKTALGHVLDPPIPGMVSSLVPQDALSSADYDDHQGLGEDDGTERGPVTDSMEQMEDQQGLVHLSAKREEVFEAETDSATARGPLRRVGFGGEEGGVRMSRAERIQHQKMLREQEEIQKEKTYDSSKMVHELKDVLGRRRLQREAGQEQDLPTTAPAPSEQTLDNTFFEQHPTPLTLQQELQTTSLETHAGEESDQVSPFTLTTSIFPSPSDIEPKVTDSGAEPAL